MRRHDDEGEEDDLIIEKKPKKNIHKGKHKRIPQKIDPNNWEEWEEDEFADFQT